MVYFLSMRVLVAAVRKLCGVWKGVAHQRRDVVGVSGRLVCLETGVVAVHRRCGGMEGCRCAHSIAVGGPISGGVVSQCRVWVLVWA